MVGKCSNICNIFAFIVAIVLPNLWFTNDFTNTYTHILCTQTHTHNYVDIYTTCRNEEKLELWEVDLCPFSFEARGLLLHSSITLEAQYIYIYTNFYRYIRN